MQWVRQGAVSVLDQGLLSGANFAISIIYARWLPAEEYGAFSVLYAAFLILAGFYNALVLEPMTIGSGQQDSTNASYTKSIFLLHWGLTVPLGVVAIVAGKAMIHNPSALGSGVTSLGISLPFILLYWLLRRRCYIRADPFRAARSSFLYLMVCSGSLILGQHRASPSFGFASMAIASSVACAPLLRLSDLRCRRSHPIALLRAHWAYGRWIVCVAALQWLTTSFYIMALATLTGLTSVALFRSAENLLLPLGQVLTAISTLVLPWLSAEFRSKGLHRLVSAAKVCAGVAIAITLSYCVSALLVARNLFALFYGNGLYKSAIVLLPILCLAVLVRSVAELSAGNSLRAAAKPSAVLWATVAGAVTSLTVGLWLIRIGGATGAAWASVATAIAQAVVLAAYFLSLRTNSSVGTATVKLQGSPGHA